MKEFCPDSKLFNILGFPLFPIATGISEPFTTSKSFVDPHGVQPATGLVMTTSIVLPKCRSDDGRLECSASTLEYLGIMDPR